MLIPNQAEEILHGCVGQNGFWASGARYKWQCWTRDFVIAVLPYVLQSGDQKLIQLAEKHLDQLRLRQKPNGQIPIIFLDNTPAWLGQKIWNSLKNRRLSFMLERYFSRDGLFSLTPWTRDSEILYVLGVGLYYQATGDMYFLERHCQAVHRAFKYIETEIMFDGLVFGADWRDTRPDLDRVMLLTNNVLLLQAYKLHGMGCQYNAALARIKEVFWTGEYFRDHPDSYNFDTFGNALAILAGIPDADECQTIFQMAEKLRTPFGYKLNDVTLPPKNAKEAELMSRIKHDGVIWPFIHGFMILALVETGQLVIAQVECFQHWESLSGFYEFYDPRTGFGHGSSDQLWSAMLYLRSRKAVMNALNR